MRGIYLMLRFFVGLYLSIIKFFVDVLRVYIKIKSLFFKYYFRYKIAEQI